MIKIIILGSVTIYIFISLIMLLKYFGALFKVKRYFNNIKTKSRNDLPNKVTFLVLIPVLREQNIISETILYFRQLNEKNIVLHLCIAGTKREYASLEKYGFTMSTKEIVEKTCAEISFSSNFSVDFFEAEDYENGDRASQLNHAALYGLQKYFDVDIIGVYDADSRPTLATFWEVAKKYLDNKNVSYQQPAFFLDVANRMTRCKENPVLIANALYQNAWSIISEIPMWIDYSNSKGKGLGNFYCIGHGEFFPRKIFELYKFPEQEVTDGIQIGYRLSMCGEQVEILGNYCNDDVPHQLLTLINQHKRWYGGCMRLMEAYRWCKNRQFNPKISTVLAGFWSQFRWAFAANLFLLNLFFSWIYIFIANTAFPFTLILVIGIVYCYILPMVATYLTPIQSRVSKVAFLLLPVAIYIKGIGPILFILNSFLRRENKYEKVER